MASTAFKATLYFTQGLRYLGTSGLWDQIASTHILAARNRDHSWRKYGEEKAFSLPPCLRGETVGLGLLT